MLSSPQVCIFIDPYKTMSCRCAHPSRNYIICSIVIDFCAGLGSNGDKKIKAAPATPVAPVAPVAKTPEKEQKTPKDKKGQPKTPTMEKVL